MKKIGLYSSLLLVGLCLSQVGPLWWPVAHAASQTGIKLLTMFCLAYIMIRVGLEFEIDKTNVKQYGWDGAIAATAAGLPWLLVGLYFVTVMAPSNLWTTMALWKQSLLVSLFSAPTSAGILFSMLAAAGLAATWVFQKARILAIFDDLATVLLIIPLKMWMVGFKWQLVMVAVVIVGLLATAWKYLHRCPWSSHWPALLGYSAGITLFCELIYLATKALDPTTPVHLEVLLPAFALGCVLIHQHSDAPRQEDRVNTLITSAFLVLVGLSMPALSGGTPSATGSTEIAEALGGRWPGWPMIAAHVLAVTVISNLGKMFIFFCYRREAAWRERLALSIGMFPRGEVGAGVLVVSLSYGLGGPALTVAMLSLAVNLACTGLFIVAVKALLTPPLATA